LWLEDISSPCGEAFEVTSSNVKVLSTLEKTMKTLGIATLFMPQSFLLPLLVMSGLFLVIGLRKLAASVAVLVLLMAISPMLEPLFNELFAMMPWWFVPLFFVGIVLMFAGRAIRDVLVHVAGDLIASSIRYSLGFPRLLASIFGMGLILWFIL